MDLDRRIAVAGIDCIGYREDIVAVAGKEVGLDLEDHHSQEEDENRSMKRALLAIAHLQRLSISWESGCKIRRKATEISTWCLRSRKVTIVFTSEIFHHKNRQQANSFTSSGLLTPRIAGSFGICGGGGLFSFGACSILRSLTSLPRKTMYS